MTNTENPREIWRNIFFDWVNDMEFDPGGRAHPNDHNLHPHDHDLQSNEHNLHPINVNRPLNDHHTQPNDQNPHPVAFDCDKHGNLIDDSNVLARLPLKPNVKTNRELNFTVIKRHLPLTQDIICQAQYTVVYTFSAAKGEWEKCGIEGTMFLVQLETGIREATGKWHERYAVVILNRKGMEDFVLELESSENVDLSSKQFIILEGGDGQYQGRQTAGGKSTDEKIYALWVFEEEGSTKGKREECRLAITKAAWIAQSASATRQV